MTATHPAVATVLFVITWPFAGLLAWVACAALAARDPGARRLYTAAAVLCTVIVTVLLLAGADLL